MRARRRLVLRRRGASLALLGCLAAARSQNAQCDAWAAADECDTNARYMHTECADACTRHRCALRVAASGCEIEPHTLRLECPHACADAAVAADYAAGVAGASAECVRWARGGECERNAAFMLSSCAAACEEHLAVDCALRAARGECESAPRGLSERCAPACARAERRRACGALECAGLPAVCSTLDAASQKRAASLSTSLPANTPFNVSFFNLGPDLLQLHWFDGVSEHPYSIVQPSSRSVQTTRMGYRWRVRTFARKGVDVSSSRTGANSPPVLEVRAGILTVGGCRCEAHARTAADYAVAAGDSGPSEWVSLLVENSAPFAVLVSRWNGTAQEPIRELGPPGGETRAHAMLEGLRDGELLSVMRRRDGALLMQHVVGAIALSTRECDAAPSIGKVHSEATRRARLQRKNSDLERQNAHLRARLGQMRELNAHSLSSIPRATLEHYAEEAGSLLHSLRKEREELR